MPERVVLFYEGRMLDEVEMTLPRVNDTVVMPSGDRYRVHAVEHVLAATPGRLALASSPAVMLHPEALPESVTVPRTGR